MLIGEGPHYKDEARIGARRYAVSCMHRLAIAGILAVCDTAWAGDRSDRRDPFVPLVERHDERCAGHGVAGMLVEEIDLVAIEPGSGRKGPVAVVVGNDGQCYELRQGTRVWNGVVKTIEGNRIIFLGSCRWYYDVRPYISIVKSVDADSTPPCTASQRRAPGAREPQRHRGTKRARGNGERDGSRTAS